MGVIDSIEESFDVGSVCQADLIYLAAPVRGIIDFIVNRGSLIKPGAIITDAGSTKRDICRAARESLPNATRFVGGHPMAGSHFAGVQHASADLFSGAPYAIVVDDVSEPESGAFEQAVSTVEEIVRAIGARPVFITAEGHDREVARVSHVPQLLAIALARAVSNHAAGPAPVLAGRGLSGMTLLAASEWTVWKDICDTNRDEIIDALEELTGEIDILRGALGSGEYSYLGEAFEDANRFVRDLNEKISGGLGKRWPHM